MVTERILVVDDEETLCEVLKSDPRTAGIPIIFCTARDSEDDMVKGLDRTTQKRTSTICATLSEMKKSRISRTTGATTRPVSIIWI